MITSYASSVHVDCTKVLLADEPRIASYSHGPGIHEYREMAVLEKILLNIWTQVKGQYKSIKKFQQLR